ncbi:hypothetical protein A3E49_02565 [Candidatus Saccharibacteria bacterium RIFCSPHIGHO2_12_FULL_49_19]|nr:MAG: hypothetical protein A3E49_02565 [Candidatus Saccharibacteria bacterium RIFCSPHIGHO2_12_FULL_49_19]
MAKKVPGSRSLFGRFGLKTSLAIIGVLALIVFVILELTGVTHFVREEKASSGTIPSSGNSESPQTSEDKSSTVPSADSSSPSETPKQGSSATSSNGAAPITPYGNFVSNHSPNLDGVPAPSSIQSVCNTSPGASCYIEFTNSDGVVKKLTSQKTDGNGATYWYWDVAQAGFTVGFWKITVVATLNGQPATVTDAINLKVGS